MIKLKKMLVEGKDDFEYEIEDLEGAEAIMQFLTNNNKSPELIELGKDKYIIWDDKILDPEYPIVKKKSDWLWDRDASQLRESLVDMVEERFNKNFWERPEFLYHGTPKENVESIQREGIKKQHISRGFANKHIRSAVFTEKSPDFCGYHYGPEVFEINTTAMKADGFMPYVTKEPNHTESEVINFLAHKIGAWEDDKDYSSATSEGTTDDTIIIYDNIPPKYVKLI